MSATKTKKGKQTTSAKGSKAPVKQFATSKAVKARPKKPEPAKATKKVKPVLKGTHVKSQKEQVISKQAPAKKVFVQKSETIIKPEAASKKKSLPVVTSPTTAAKSSAVAKLKPKPEIKESIVAKPVAKKVPPQKKPVETIAKVKVAKTKVIDIRSLEESQPLPPSTGFMGIPPYEETPNEAYMSLRQRDHFKQILLTWKKALMEEVDRTMSHMKDEAANFADPNDRASLEEEFSLELRARDRERKLIKKIDEALKSIQEDAYGYCEACGVEIGIRRLEARPTANLCIDCKTLAELKEKQISG